MKKLMSLFVTAIFIVALSLNVFASGPQDLETETYIEDGVALVANAQAFSPAESNVQVEAASAAAIVNSDSFVDKVADQNNFDISAKAGLLMDETTGQILYAKNIDENLPIASITKVMTMLLVFEAIDSGKIKMEDTVPISPHAFSMGGSQIWLEPGEIFTVHELLKAVAVASANDAAVALAEFIGGSETGFCDMMNNRAKELGMEKTHFVNACGLDAEGHLSCAKDVAIMSRELMKHTQVFEYTTIWMDYLRNGQTQIVNTNKLLRRYNGITGLKTGTTSKAGVCVTATAKRDNMSFIAVVLGSPSGDERFEAATRLLDFGFSNFESKPFPAIQAYPEEIDVRFGVQKKVKLDYELPNNMLFLKGSTSNLESRITIPEYIDAPISQGTQIGNVELYSGGEKIKQYPIKIGENVEKVDLKKALSILINIVCKM